MPEGETIRAADATTPATGHSICEGLPYPLGATPDANGVNFALFSANATRVELCLFDADGVVELERIAMPEYTDEVWHVHVEGLRPGAIYGYRVHGPYDPPNGHRFNPNKLLLDPYARAHHGALRWTAEIFGYPIEDDDDPNADLGFDVRDSAPFVPKCVVVDSAFEWSNASRPRIAWDQTIVYETHVRGYTMRHPAVPEAARGTFAGLGHEAVLDHLKALGVTSVELLPVHTFVGDGPLPVSGPRNYWGYNTIGFFAADPLLFLEEGRRRAEDDDRSAARRRPRGHPRRRLQPHRRGERARRDAVVPWHRQRVVLPPDARRPASLPERRGHRQHLEPRRIRASCRWSPTVFATGSPR